MGEIWRCCSNQIRSAKVHFKALGFEVCVGLFSLQKRANDYHPQLNERRQFKDPRQG